MPLALLNSLSSLVFVDKPDPMFANAQQSMATTVLKSDLASLAFTFEESIKRLLAKGGRPPSSKSAPASEISKKDCDGEEYVDQQSTNMRVQPGSPVSRKKSVVDEVKKRDGHKCVLTLSRQQIEVAHIIPFSCSKELGKSSLDFVCQLTGWAMDPQKIDSAENAIVLGSSPHRALGEFCWFITIEDPSADNVEGGTMFEQQYVYRPEASAKTSLVYQTLRRQPTHNVELGKSEPQGLRPSLPFVKLHELLSRIIYMRGGAATFIDYSEYEEECVRRIVTLSQYITVYLKESTHYIGDGVSVIEWRRRRQLVRILLN
ncbi:hypothetical protein BC829DRAFT_422141 [Chytridium lagenaria]|nr:hypothetical protein BC829DRAFT_422141 [Chytridium lagenaria]